MISTRPKNVVSLKNKQASRNKKQGDIPPPPPLIPPPQVSVLKSSIVWEDAYPLLLETIKVNSELTIEVKRSVSTQDPSFNNFLYRVIRPEQRDKGDKELNLNLSLPTFVKTNFKKIKKMIEKELKTRSKMQESMSKEQIAAFQSFFKDEQFFQRGEHSEFFDHELEQVYVNYLRSYLDSSLYESRVKSLNKKRLQILEKHGILK